MKYILVFLFTFPIFSETGLRYWQNLPKNLKSSLFKYIDCKSIEYLENQECIQKFPNLELDTDLGLFITFFSKKNKKVRGCFGAFDHQSVHTKFIFNNYILGALKEDPRYESIQKEEWDDLELILTITEKPRILKNIEEVDLRKFGIVLRNDRNQNFILVPSEIKSLEQIKSIIKKNRITEFEYFKTTILRKEIK
jgi:AMMECR1 domain-containing protein